MARVDLSKAKWENIPTHTQETIRRYLEDSSHPGDFLRAVIANDLIDAVRRADDQNRHHLADIVDFFRRHAPGDAYGSPEIFDGWILSAPARE